MIKRWGTISLVSFILVVFAVGLGSNRFLVNPEPPAQTAPVRPTEIAPEPPVPTAPVRPAETAPEPPAQTAPVRPTESAPEPPAQTTLVRPTEVAPEPLAQAAPVAPAPASTWGAAETTGMRLRIPSLSIDAEVVAVGLTEDGAMAAPPGYDHVAWYKYGARPGEPGRAVIAGHVDSRNGPAVFWDLKHLAPGDTLLVEDTRAQITYSFTIRQIDVYEVTQAPLQRIFGPSDQRELILITCGGTFDPKVQEYTHRVVVYATD